MAWRSRPRGIIDRALALSRAHRKTIGPSTLPRDNPFYAFTELAPFISHDEVVDLALQSYPVRVLSAIQLFEPLGDALVPVLSARALDLAGARNPELAELAVIVLGLGRILARRGEALDPALDPLLGALVAAASDLVSSDTYKTFALHDPSPGAGDPRDGRRLLVEVLLALPIERREAVLAGVPKLPFYFFGVCPTPLVAERAVACTTALDEIDVRDREGQIAAALRALGRAALPWLMAALEAKRLPARAPFVAALADLAAPEALGTLAARMIDPVTVNEAKRGVSAIDESTRLAFATEALADRDRARRLEGAMVLETLGRSTEAVKLASARLAAERAKAVREVLERIARSGR